MIRRTFRINDHLYTKLRLMAKYENMSINKLMIKLIEIGFIEKEKSLSVNEWRNINEKRFR